MLALEQLSWCYSQNRKRLIESQYAAQNNQRLDISDDRNVLAENATYAPHFNLVWDRLPFCEIVSAGLPVSYPSTTLSEVCKPDRLFMEQTKKK
jgi:hypothetical protein